MGVRYLSDKIVKWYLDNRRPLPWRETSDPYRIWLSEVILQQTRVIQGLPYYQQFIKKYPSVRHLAKAPEQEVLRLWQGLGYYTRARNLHKCAKSIVSLHNARFPDNFQDLLKLPGVGHYTAAAIASLAFEQRVAVLDGNVFRVLSRVFGIETPINSPQGRKQFAQLANVLIPDSMPGLHNQAVMEFGALFCTPRNPRCTLCPLKSGCVAYRQNLVRLLPVKKPGKKSRHRYFHYLVVEKQNSILMRKREEKDIWNGLFDFVLIEKDRPVKLQQLMAEKPHRKWFQKMDAVSISKVYKHILTHQTIHCRFIHIKTRTSSILMKNGLSFYSPGQIERLPKPVLISRFLKEQNHH